MLTKSRYGRSKNKIQFFHLLYGCACLKDKTSQPKQNQWPFRFFTQLKFEGTGQNLTISFWLEWYGLVAKGPGSHPRGAGSIPGTEPNWPGNVWPGCWIIFFWAYFCCFQAPWPVESHVCISSNNCQCWTNAVWNVVIILPCLFAPQIWVESLLLFSSI